MVDDAVVPLIVDLTVFTICTMLLLRLGRLSAMHPATTYLFFHFWVVTKRLAELAAGSPLSAAFPNQPIVLTEISRASLLFDVALVVMTTAWIITSAMDYKRNGPLPEFGQEKAPNLSRSYMVVTAQVMIPLGIFGLIKAHSGGGDSSWDKSSVSNLSNGWLPLALMPLFYWYGPRKWVVALALVVGVVNEVYSGNTRWLLLLPTIFFCYAYLSRTGRRWPSRKVVIVLAIAGVLWLPGKQISDVIAGGGNITDVAQTLTSVWTMSSTQSNQPDTIFLDMAAMTLTLVDQHGTFYYGDTVWPAFFNFIPRPLWPDKPVAYSWEIEISTKDRPMATYGMTPSIVGAAYADLGYAGIVIIPFLFALFLGWAYFQAFRSSHYSIGRFFYLVIACTLFQPFRDGMYSFFIFNFVWLMPLDFIVFLHLVFPTRPARGRPHYPRPIRLSPAGMESRGGASRRLSE